MKKLLIILMVLPMLFVGMCSFSEGRNVEVIKVKWKDGSKLRTHYRHIIVVDDDPSTFMVSRDRRRYKKAIRAERHERWKKK